MMTIRTKGCNCETCKWKAIIKNYNHNYDADDNIDNNTDEDNYNNNDYDYEIENIYWNKRRNKK